MEDAQPRLMSAWARDMQDLFDRIDEVTAKVIDENPRSAGFLETPEEATDGVERELRERQAPEEAWIGEIIQQSEIEAEIEEELNRIYARHSLAVANETVRILDVTFGGSWNLPDHVARQVIAEGGRRLGLIDMTAQARREMFKELLKLRTEGKGPREIARRLAGKISQGVFRDSKTRALVIARTETLHAQRFSSLKIYEAHPNFSAIKIFDGQYGPPRSDDICINRNGDIVSFEEAQEIMDDEHPNGTLVLTPVASPPKPGAE